MGRRGLSGPRHGLFNGAVGINTDDATSACALPSRERGRSFGTLPLGSFGFTRHDPPVTMANDSGERRRPPRRRWPSCFTGSGENVSHCTSGLVNSPIVAIDALGFDGARAVLLGRCGCGSPLFLVGMAGPAACGSCRGFNPCAMADSLLLGGFEGDSFLDDAHSSHERRLGRRAGGGGCGGGGCGGGGCGGAALLRSGDDERKMRTGAAVCAPPYASGCCAAAGCRDGSREVLESFLRATLRGGVSNLCACMRDE
jgi:hypothetical protein